MSDTREERRVIETAKRDSILRVLAAVRKEYLRLIRYEMKRLAPMRGYVTAEDAREFFESLEDVPSPNVLNRNFLGAVFKTTDWTTDGATVCSSTEGRHGNRVFLWRLRPR